MNRANQLKARDEICDRLLQARYQLMHVNTPGELPSTEDWAKVHDILANLLPAIAELEAQTTEDPGLKVFTATYEFRRYETRAVSVRAQDLGEAKATAEALGFSEVFQDSRHLDSGFFIDDAMILIDVQETNQ